MSFYRHIVFLFTFLFGVVFLTHSVQAQSVIRDTEIETLLYAYSDPIFDAAGVDKNAVDLILINSPTVNAFVAGGSNIFLYTGLILETDTPLELVSVIAHETGHITGGHLVRLSDALEGAQINSLIGMLLGGVVAAGTGQGEGGIAASSAAQAIIERNILSYARVQENSADQASFKFLHEAGLKLSGAVSFFKKLYESEGSSSSYTNEYARTHPLTKNRVIAAEEKEKLYNEGDDLSSLQNIHERMQAKIFAYTYPKQVAFLYGGDSLNDQYAQAIAAYRLDNLDIFLGKIDDLIEAEPDNPYFYELKGQALFENGRLDEAIESLKKAISLLPNAPLIRTLYAHALLETGIEANIKESIEHINTALRQERVNGFRYHLLSLAYGRLGDNERAKLYQAHKALLSGDSEQLKKLLNDLEGVFDRGSAEWLKVEDLKNFNKKTTK